MGIEKHIKAISSNLRKIFKIFKKKKLKNAWLFQFIIIFINIE